MTSKRDSADPFRLDEIPEVQRQTELIRAVCWECGEEKLCHEYVVCCTGTLFHVCPECERPVES